MAPGWLKGGKHHFQEKPMALPFCLIARQSFLSHEHDKDERAASPDVHFHDVHMKARNVVCGSRPSIAPPTRLRHHPPGTRERRAERAGRRCRSEASAAAPHSPPDPPLLHYPPPRPAALGRMAVGKSEPQTTIAHARHCSGCHPCCCCCCFHSFSSSPGSASPAILEVLRALLLVGLPNCFRHYHCHCCQWPLLPASSAIPPPPPPPPLLVPTPRTCWQPQQPRGCCSPHRTTRQHTATRAGKQGSRQAGKQASRQAGRQVSKEAGKQAGREAGKQASRQAGKQGSRDRQGGVG